MAMIPNFLPYASATCAYIPTANVAVAARTLPTQDISLSVRGDPVGDWSDWRILDMGDIQPACRPYVSNVVLAGRI